MRSNTLCSPLIALAVVVSSALAASTSDACPNTISKDELFISSYFGCQIGYMTWARSAFGVNGGENWDSPGNGGGDVCNVAQPFHKWMNSTVLYTNGLSKNTKNGMPRSFFTDGGLQWHGMEDYQFTAQAPANNYHDGVYYNLRDDVTPPPATLVTWARGEYKKTWTPISGTTTYEWTNLYCQVFENSTGSPSSDPAFRAAAALHEGWHHWQVKNGYKIDHEPCPPGSPGGSCDKYYWHKISRYSFGDMWMHETGEPLFHSPTQVQMEFLCDIADEGKDDYISPSIALLAKLEAKLLAANQFTNPVGWTCGDNRIPMYP